MIHHFPYHNQGKIADPTLNHVRPSPGFCFIQLLSHLAKEHQKVFHLNRYQLFLLLLLEKRIVLFGLIFQ